MRWSSRRTLSGLEDCDLRVAYRHTISSRGLPLTHAHVAHVRLVLALLSLSPLESRASRIISHMCQLSRLFLFYVAALFPARDRTGTLSRSLRLYTHYH